MRRVVLTSARLWPTPLSSPRLVPLLRVQRLLSTMLSPTISISSSSSPSPSPSPDDVSYLNAADAAALDTDLMSDAYGFTLDQLMELAGLSVACATHQLYPPSSHPSVLLLIGPGNNGGDGLVAARHLHHFGYRPTLLIPRPPSRQPYLHLHAQTSALSIPTLATPPPTYAAYHLIIDAVFGFSFNSHDGIRAPYADLLCSLPRLPHPPMLSVDVPSGWHVEEGDVGGAGLRPEALVSLTAPKLCARRFEGKYHAVGGRFVPPGVRDKYGLRLPAYEGREQFVLLKGKPNTARQAAGHTHTVVNVDAKFT